VLCATRAARAGPQTPPMRCSIKSIPVGTPALVWIGPSVTNTRLRSTWQADIRPRPPGRSSRGAITTTMPMPLLKVRFISNVVNAGSGLQPGKQLGLGPAALLQVGGQAVGQHAGNVLQQAAAGDVGQCLDAAVCSGWAASAASTFFTYRRVGSMMAAGRACRPAWRAAVSPARSMHLRTRLKPLECTPPRPGPAPRRRPERCAGQDLAFFDRAHAKTSQVVLASGVHAGHLGGFAADQGAAAQFTTLGNATHHSGGGVDIELAAGKVVQEKQGLGALAPARR
jgi:hypothetical protein